MSYLLFAWIASIVYGIEVVVGKLTSTHTIPNPWLLNFIWSFFIILFILPVAIMNHVGLPHFTANLFWTSFFYAVTNIFYILSLQVMDVTALGPLFNFRSVFSVILGVIMLGEKLSPWHVVLIGLIFIGGILVNVDEKLKLKAFFRPAMAIVMLFLLTLSLLGVYTNLAIAENGFWTTTLWSIVIAQVMTLITLPLFWKHLLKTKVKKYSGLFVMSIASAVASLTANRAYASNAGITSVILSLPFSMIFTICISVFNPKLMEHHKAKIYAVRVAAAGVMLLAAIELSRV